jgi:hypothetical protein
MKFYRCHKTVHAEPMTSNDYIIRYKAQLDLVANEKGYHVIYSLGTSDEYHSWSPKKAFEDGYTEIELAKDF